MTRMGQKMWWFHEDAAYTTSDAGTVKPSLSGPLLSRSPAIRKKIVSYRFTAYAMHTTHTVCHTVCVFDYPVPYQIFSWKTDVCGYARSDLNADDLAFFHNLQTDVSLMAKETRKELRSSGGFWRLCLKRAGRRTLLPR